MNTGVFGDTRRTETHKIYAELSSINKSIGVLNQGICVTLDEEGTHPYLISQQ